MKLSQKLDTSNKVLFIVHLAIGDFTYMQNCFNSFKKQYPTIDMDIFIQDIRMTDDESQWLHLKSYILCDWLKQTELFNNIYHAYSPQVYKSTVEKLKKESYDVTISLGDLRSQNYSNLAREIAQNNIAVGINIKTSLFSRHKKLLRKLDIRLEDKQEKSIHISQKFAFWFQQMGVDIEKEQLFPTIIIPQKQQDYIDEKLRSWRHYDQSPIIFINIYAKGEERCWSIDQAVNLISQLKTRDIYKNSLYILNSPPEEQSYLSQEILKKNLDNTEIFSATQNFFELPALLKRCDLIITVDTSIMHLACISKGLLISLVRKKKQEGDIRWMPLKKKNSVILSTAKCSDSITLIKIERVLQIIDQKTA